MTMTEYERLRARTLIRDRYRQLREELRQANSSLLDVDHRASQLPSEKAVVRTQIEEELQAINAQVVAGMSPSDLAAAKHGLTTRLKALDADFAEADEVLRRERGRLTAKRDELLDQCDPAREHAELFRYGNPDLVVRHAVATNRAEWADMRLREASHLLRTRAADPHLPAIVEDASRTATAARNDAAAMYNAIVAE